MRRSLLIIGFASSLLAACASAPPPAAPMVAPPPAPPAAPPMPAPKPMVAPVVESKVVPLHLDPNSALSREHSVYFDFDTSQMRAGSAAVVDRHGEYLAHAPALSVVVQGNTDERGGSEYNLALGQRRAESVKAALKLLGVKDSQVEAVSFGKEKPVATGHDEAAWQQNRRADIVYAK